MGISVASFCLTSNSLSLGSYNNGAVPIDYARGFMYMPVSNLYKDSDMNDTTH